MNKTRFDERRPQVGECAFSIPSTVSLLVLIGLALVATFLTFLDELSGRAK